MTMHNDAQGAMQDDDPTANEQWNAGCDFALAHLCKFLGVDFKAVSWDAATETVDGDVLAVIGNILRVKFGEDWGPNDAPALTEGDRLSREELHKQHAADWTRQIINAGGDENVALQAVTLAALNGLFDHLGANPSQIPSTERGSAA